MRNTPKLHSRFSKNCRISVRKKKNSDSKIHHEKQASCVNHPHRYRLHQSQANGAMAVACRQELIPHSKQISLYIRFVKIDTDEHRSECIKCNDTLRLNNENHVVSLPIATWNLCHTKRYPFHVHIEQTKAHRNLSRMPHLHTYVLGFYGNEVTIYSVCCLP